MIDLVLVFAIVAALLFLLLLASRRDSVEGGAGAGLSDDLEYAARLPERALLERCLSADDVEFAAVLRNSPVLRLLLRERRRLALAWLRETRREATRVYGLHVGTVRNAADLRPAAEAKLFFAVGLFFLTYALTVATVWLYGPFRTRRFLHSVQIQAQVLSHLGSRIADSITPKAVPPLYALPRAR